MINALTEPGLTATASETALTTYLISRDSVLALVPYRGALTPQRLDAPEVEIGALLRGAAVHDLGWLRRIAVRGEDRFRWLSGMVTNSVETLPDHSGAYNLVLNAQGRIQGDAYVWRSGDELEIEITAEQSEALPSHFDGFIIMDDVELIPLPHLSAVGITGPEADGILAKLRLPALAEALLSTTGAIGEIPIQLCRSFGTLMPHYILWTATEHIAALWQTILAAGATAVGAAALETLRIVEGIPAYGIDIESRYLAQETGQTRALSFTKGCYLGQEIVERIRSQGQVHRHLRAVELVSDGQGELPVVGTELFSPNIAGKPAGTLSSVTALQLDGVQRIFGIAMVRAEAEVGSEPLTYVSGGRDGWALILKSAPKLTKFAAA